jgi:uncharacterized protein YkwD
MNIRHILATALFLWALSPLWMASPLAAQSSEKSSGNALYIPVAMNDANNATATNTLAAPPCQLSAEEQQFFDLMKANPEQKRPTLVCNAILAQVARARAQDMADRNYFSHVNPDGYGPNYLVTAAGYTLPAFYSQSSNGNNIESIAAGYANDQAAWDALLSSEHHRTHVLGLDSFYAEQTDIGIGYVSVDNSEYVRYWVIITAKSQ